MGAVCQLDRSTFELVEVPDAEGVTWVRAVADLDLLSASDGYAQLLTIWRNGPLDRRLVVELDTGRFVDVRGLRMLLEISRVVRDQGGAMVLLSSSRTVARVLAILDPDGELSFSRSVADAQTCRPPAAPGAIF
jgi:anti-anti-sigma factor